MSNKVYGISRWTNPSRGSALHIDDGYGKPLCRDRRKVFSWEKAEEGEPSCRKCINLVKDVAKTLQGIVGK